MITLAQESRFQLVDERGIAHLFVLSAHAATEASDLSVLQRGQARVRVRYEDAHRMIGHVAASVERSPSAA